MVTVKRVIRRVVALPQLMREVWFAYLLWRLDTDSPESPMPAGVALLNELQLAVITREASLWRAVFSGGRRTRAEA